MNRQTIMELAEQAGGEFVGRGIMTELCTYSYSLEFESLERFAMLVRDHALEEAASYCQEECDAPALAMLEKYRAAFIRDAIRALKQSDPS